MCQSMVLCCTQYALPFSTIFFLLAASLHFSFVFFYAFWWCVSYGRCRYVDIFIFFFFHFKLLLFFFLCLLHPIIIHTNTDVYIIWFDGNSLKQWKECNIFVHQSMQIPFLDIMFVNWISAHNFFHSLSLSTSTEKLSLIAQLLFFFFFVLSGINFSYIMLMQYYSNHTWQTESKDSILRINI